MDKTYFVKIPKSTSTETLNEWADMYNKINIIKNTDTSNMHKYDIKYENSKNIILSVEMDNCNIFHKKYNSTITSEPYYKSYLIYNSNSPAHLFFTGLLNKMNSHLHTDIIISNGVTNVNMKCAEKEGDTVVKYMTIINSSDLKLITTDQTKQVAKTEFIFGTNDIKLLINKQYKVTRVDIKITQLFKKKDSSNKESWGISIKLKAIHMKYVPYVPKSENKLVKIDKQMKKITVNESNKIIEDEVKKILNKNKDIGAI